MKNEQLDSIPHVVILTSSIVKGLQEMLQGVLQYAQEHGPWRIYQQENRPWTYCLKDFKQWGCTGIIAAAHHSVEEARVIAAAGVPVIVLLQPHPMHQPDYPLFHFPCVIWDSIAIGRMAARYFLDRSFRQFGFVGDTYSATYWSREREHGFYEVLKEAGFEETFHKYGVCSELESQDWAVERPRMEQWLKSLPKPIAIFAPNDRRGKQVLDACLDAGISVPDEVSVLGVDNDEWICEAAVPNLSSIQCNPMLAGRQIAVHFARMLQGEPISKAEYSIAPIRVVTRQSTNWEAIPDRKIAKARTYIREHAENADLRVDAVAKFIGLSRRATEIRFRNAVGRTVREEIEHIRLKRVKALLIESDIQIVDVARRCGFASETHLGRIFKSRFNTTMNRFRVDQTNIQ
jgi:LacI family transcriptional regulator